MLTNKLELRSYQKAAVNLIKDNIRYGLFLFLGAGKTVSTLTAISELLKENKIKRVLILAPLNIAKSTWKDEIEKWDELKHLQYEICTGDMTHHKRSLAVHKQCDIVISNFDNIKWLHKNKYTTWDMVVVDESSAFKSYKSLRFKMLKTFKYTYMTLLSGTPTPNNYLDLWSQMYLLDNGGALGKHYTKFRRNYFYPTDYMQYKWAPKNPDDIFNKIKHLVCTIKAEDCVNLPDKINIITKVNIPEKGYEDLKNKYILTDNGQTALATKNNVLLNKLAQYCSGAVYETDEDVSLKTIHIHDAKLDALETIIENNPDENILVAYKYKSDLLRLQARFKNAQVLSTDNIADWNSKKIKLMLCQPASCSMGLNLQFGGNIIVWFSLTWNLEHYLQFNGRLHRPGQTKPVIVNHLVAKLPRIKTVDQIIINSLYLKNISQKKLMFELLKDL